VLAKAFGVAATEYRDIAVRLREAGVMTGEQAESVARLAGYPNRLVHFYHEIGNRELYEICASQLGDVDGAADAVAAWIAANTQRVDGNA